MRTFRVLPDSPGWGAHYEEFENRVRAFVTRYLHDTDVTDAVQDCRARLVQAPLTTGYWVGYDDEGIPCAHLYSYIAANFRKPFLCFNQIEFDPSASLLEPMHSIIDEIGVWITNLNRVYEASNSSSRITYGESMTWIDPKIYERLFKNTAFAPKASRTVFRWDLSSTEQTKTLMSIDLPKWAN